MSCEWKTSECCLPETAPGSSARSLILVVAALLKSGVTVEPNLGESAQKSRSKRSCPAVGRRKLHQSRGRHNPGKSRYFQRLPTARPARRRDGFCALLSPSCPHSHS